MERYWYGVDQLLKQVHLYPGVENDNADDELEEGEWIPDETYEVIDACGVASDEGICESSICIPRL